MILYVDGGDKTRRTSSAREQGSDRLFCLCDGDTREKFLATPLGAMSIGFGKADRVYV
jgi:hypothetical protein